MNEISPRKILLISFGLLLLGWIFPLLMVLRVIEPSLWLSFLSWGAMVLGLLLSVIGVAGVIRLRKR